MTLVIAIDPGTGSSSACGLAAFDSVTKEIKTYSAFWPEHYKTPAIRRIKDVVEQLEKQINQIIALNNAPLVVAIESFVMRGKGGETLQRMIGAALTRIPYDVEIREVSNTGMKKFVGSTGKADKKQVGQGVLAYFKDNVKSAELITALILTEEHDVLDAFGIGIAAVGSVSRPLGAERESDSNLGKTGFRKVNTR